MSAALSSDGFYRWDLSSYICGVFQAWYTCHGCDNNPATGANYGVEGNIEQVSAVGKQWLTCSSPGYDIRFLKSCVSNTLVPAGCGMGI